MVSASKILEHGTLYFESVADPFKVFTLNKSRIIKKIGKLSKKKSQEVVKNMINYTQIKS